MATCKNCRKPILRCAPGDACASMSEFEGWFHADGGSHCCGADTRPVAEPDTEATP